MRTPDNRRPAPFLCLTVAVASLIAPTSAAASNEALLKLLQVLRDRGSISADEYEAIRQLASASDVAVAPAETSELGRPAAVRDGTEQPMAPLPTDEAPAVAPNGAGTSITSSPDQTGSTRVDGQTARPQSTQRNGDAPWYERFGLRGYTQFRLTESAVGEGPPLDVPADRSVNESESFVIRRGRLVLSGDVSDRLSLYAQSDLSASTGAPDFSLQLRDLYGDFRFNAAKTWRVRVGQSKVPFGWVNMQSSQNRAAIERPDGLNSAVEGERDIGAFLMWESDEARKRFRDLVSSGLKGSGDYGVVALGAYSGQGLNRSDQDGRPHVLGRVSYPFRLDSGQFIELGAQAYHGRFVTPIQAIAVDGREVTPDRAASGVTDQRVGMTAIWYPQPFGVDAEWNVGRGPQLSDDQLTIESRWLSGGYLQFNYRQVDTFATWFPFVRWNYYRGGRKFARNAPAMRVNELDFGFEFAKWAELEATIMYTRTFERSRTSLFPYAISRAGNRVGFQVQWNY